MSDRSFTCSASQKQLQEQPLYNVSNSEELRQFDGEDVHSTYVAGVGLCIHDFCAPPQVLTNVLGQRWDIWTALDRCPYARPQETDAVSTHSRSYNMQKGEVHGSSVFSKISGCGRAKYAGICREYSHR